MNVTIKVLKTLNRIVEKYWPISFTVDCHLKAKEQMDSGYFQIQ